MQFLSGWKVELSKLPTYDHFKGDGKEKLDYPLLQTIYESDFLQSKPEIKANLKNIIDKIDKKTGILKVKHNQRYKCGRFYADESISLIPLSKYIKHTVFKYMGWLDIDMVKGHPSIAIEMGKSVGMQFPAFEYYVNSFNEICEVLSKFYSEDENDPLIKDNIKWLFNSMIYGGGFENWVKGVEKGDEDYSPKTLKNKDIIHPIVKNFKEECKIIMDKIYKENPSLAKKVSVNKKEIYEKKCTTCSYWFQIIENHIVYGVAELLLERGILKPRQFGEEYDGLNIPPCDKFDKDQLTEEINALVKEQTGLNIKFKFKEYDNDKILYDCIKTRENMIIATTEDENKQDEQENTTEKITGVFTDLEASQVVFSLYKHWVCCKDELFVFDDETGLWTNNNNIITKVISRFTNSLYVLKENEKGIATKTKKSYGNTTHLTRDMLPFLKSLCINENWEKQTSSTSLGKILFNNGYYNFKESKFYSKEEYGFNPDIVFTGKIHNDFLPFDDDDMTYIKDIKQRLFYDALGKEVGDYFILNLARGLAGDCIKLKRILFGLGDSNTGKTVLSMAVMLACGDYVGSFNAENLAYRNTSNDEAQIMRWMMLLKNKRIIFSNEMKNTTDLNGNMIKKISSGGDYLIGRTHGGVEEEFQTHFLPICFANDIPKIKPYDDAVNGRVRVISYNKVYVENPTNEFELKMDVNIKDEIKTQRFQRIFVGLLIQQYMDYMRDGEPDEPMEVITAKQEWISEDTDVLNSFLKDFTVTNNKEDYIKSSEIKD
eukprot:gene14629-31130_t